MKSAAPPRTPAPTSELVMKIRARVQVTETGRWPVARIDVGDVPAVDVVRLAKRPVPHTRSRGDPCTPTAPTTAEARTSGSDLDHRHNDPATPHMAAPYVIGHGLCGAHNAALCVAITSMSNAIPTSQIRSFCGGAVGVSTASSGSATPRSRRMAWRSCRSADATS